MLLLGAHMSIAGGMDKALDRGAQLGCTAIQVFTKSTNQWAARPLGEDEVQRFQEKRKALGIRSIVAHDSYLPNLGSPDPALWRKSVDSFVGELERCRLLDLPGLVTHPGAHMGAGEEEGMQRVAEGLNEALARTLGSPVRVILEQTAGQGTVLGWRFEHLARIAELVDARDRMGACLDTCHLFAAGYPIDTEEGYEKTLAEFARIVGLKRLHVVHLNDSKKGLGSRVDRHEHIGKGCLGLDAFRRVMNDRRFARIPKLLETPKEADMAEDRENLAVLRGLVEV